jgi:hypothetical protein
MNILRLCLWLSCAAAPVGAATPDLNSYVLQAMRRMPQGGDYSVETIAFERLAAAARNGEGSLELQPALAAPSFCSGATYLVFLKVLAALHSEGHIALAPAVRQALLINRPQPDGHGVWGRWNANGPGTARFFAETGLGVNFTAWERARPGDFMKIWWTREIGHRERGHSVIYLGTETVGGIEHVRFWSSNKPGGYGEKTVPRTEVKWAVFSRLERPARITRVLDLPPVEDYLASLLKVPTTRAKVISLCRVQE